MVALFQDISISAIIYFIFSLHSRLKLVSAQHRPDLSFVFYSFLRTIPSRTHNPDGN